MSEITWEKAQALLELAKKTALAEFRRPVCVALCDAQGVLISFGRMEGTPVRCVAIAQQKAYTASRMESGTDQFLERLRQEKVEISNFCDTLLTALPGGQVLRSSAGQLCGGVGISGLAPSEDQRLATIIADFYSSLQ